MVLYYCRGKVKKEMVGYWLRTWKKSKVSADILQLAACCELMIRVKILSGACDARVSVISSVLFLPGISLFFFIYIYIGLELRPYYTGPMAWCPRV